MSKKNRMEVFDDKGDHVTGCNPSVKQTTQNGATNSCTWYHYSSSSNSPKLRITDDVRMFFLGSPLVDVTANVDDDFLKKYDLRPDNAYSVDDDNRKVFDEIRTGASVTIGGSVTNTARTFKKFTESPELVVYFLGTVGNDDWGKYVKNELDKEDLGAELTVTEGNTGKVAVLLRGKARTLVTDLGVSRIFSLDEKIQAKIEEPCLVYLSGFFINVSLETITQLISENKTLAFNLGAPFLCTKFPEEMTRIYRHSSLIFGNESEHRAFGKIHNITSTNLADVIVSTNQRLSNRSRVVMATRGGGSVLVVLDSHWLEFEVEPLDELKIVDTNGAGDAFAGGFLARYVVGDSVANCTKFGIKIARKVVQNVGFVLD